MNYWKVRVDRQLWVTTPERPNPVTQSQEGPDILWDLPRGPWPNSLDKYGGRPPRASGRKGKRTTWNREQLVLPSKACFQGKVTNQSLTELEKENAQLQPTLTILCQLDGEKKMETHLWCSQSRTHRLTKSLRPNHRIRECSPSLKSPYHVTKGLCATVPFTQYIMSTYQEKIKTYQKTRNTVWRDSQSQIRQGCWNYQTANFK